MGISDPEDNHRNHPEGAVALGALVVARGQGAELLAAGDQPLDPVAQPVRRAVEAASPALGPQPRDGVADAAPAAVGAPCAPGVAAVAHHAEMDLGGEAALAAPQRLRFRVPPFAPAACWCARITVPSTKWTPQSSCPAASACCCTAASMPSQTPARRQRRKRV